MSVPDIGWVHLTPPARYQSSAARPSQHWQLSVLDLSTSLPSPPRTPTQAPTFPPPRRLSTHPHSTTELRSLECARQEAWGLLISWLISDDITARLNQKLFVESRNHEPEVHLYPRITFTSAPYLHPQQVCSDSWMATSTLSTNLLNLLQFTVAWLHKTPAHNSNPEVALLLPHSDDP